MSCSYSESGKKLSSSTSAHYVSVKSGELVSPQGPSSSNYVIPENDLKKMESLHQQRCSKLSSEMSRDEQIQLIKDMDSSLEQFGVTTGRKTLAENWNTWQEFCTKPQISFTESTLRQEMDSSRIIIENLKKVLVFFNH